MNSVYPDRPETSFARLGRVNPAESIGVKSDRVNQGQPNPSQVLTGQSDPTWSVEWCQRLVYWRHYSGILKKEKKKIRTRVITCALLFVPHVTTRLGAWESIQCVVCTCVAQILSHMRCGLLRCPIFFLNLVLLKLIFGHFCIKNIWFLTYKDLVLDKKCVNLLCVREIEPVFRFLEDSRGF